MEIRLREQQLLEPCRALNAQAFRVTLEDLATVKTLRDLNCIRKKYKEICELEQIELEEVLSRGNGR